MISLVAAVAENGVMGGKHGGIPWQGQLPSEVEFFHNLINPHTVVMGSTTFKEYSPHHLPGIRQIILYPGDDLTVPNTAVVAHTLEEARRLFDPNDEIMVIGGRQCFMAFMPSADRMYITRVAASFDGGVFFPPFSSDEWQLVEHRPHQTAEGDRYQYDIEIYDRIKQAQALAA